MTLAYTEALRPDPPDQPLQGRVLEGRYAVGLPLGKGGMGTVYAGKQLRLDRDVAIKVLDPALNKNPEVAARFMREAKLLSRIRHPNVIQVLDYGETDDGLMYCVMELLVGSDLEQLQRKMPHGCMPWPGACDLLAQIADGLAATHARGIVHRDVKSSNCFVSFETGRTPVVKVLDFGVARAVRGDAGAKLTQAGLLIGTPSHIAPELLTSPSPATPRSDLYALGVTAYRLLSGNLPFVGDTLFAQMNAACSKDPEALDDPDLDIPMELQQLVMGLLEKDPATRIDDAAEVATRFRLVAGRGAAPALPFELPFGSGGAANNDVDTMVASPVRLFDPEPIADVTLLELTSDAEESIEEIDACDVELVDVEPRWHDDPRMWVLCALVLAVAGLCALVVFTDAPESVRSMPEQASW
jgi:serine/threonine-protein kinase